MPGKAAEDQPGQHRPGAYRYLRWNIELNGLHNVTSFSVALAARSSVQKMASFGSELGDSMSSLLEGGKSLNGAEVLTLGWRDFLERYELGRMDFLKIDIEGGEYALLPEMKDYLAQHRPTVYLSTHAPFLDGNERKEKMETIIDIMGIYKTCLDDNLQPMDIRTLVGQDALDGFCSCVFTD